MSNNTWDSIAPAQRICASASSKDGDINGGVVIQEAEEDNEKEEEEVASFEPAKSDTRAVLHSSEGSASAMARDPCLWEDDNGDTIWDPCRILVAKVILSKPLEIVIAVIIVMNVALIIYETDKEAKCYPEFKGRLGECPTQDIRWLVVCNNIFLAIYLTEAAAAIFALRLQYFTKPTCLFDFFICFCGVFALLFGAVINISWLRILRCGRILKALTFINHIPELYMLFAGFGAAMKAVLFGGIALLGMLGFCSILTVQLVHPVSSGIQWIECERCPRGFATVFGSMLTLFQQIVAGDAWGAISVPVIEASQIGLLLPLIQLVIGVGAMNLILAVVVDRSVEAREANKDRMRAQEADGRKVRKEELLHLLRTMDFDGSDGIDRSEIEKAKATNLDLQKHMFLAGIDQKEFEAIVEKIEEPTTGETGCVPLCNALYAVEAADVRKTVVMLKLCLDRMNETLMERMDTQDKNLEAMRQQLTEIAQGRKSRGLSSQETYGVDCRPFELPPGPSEDISNRPSLASPSVCREAVQSFEVQAAKEADRLQQSFATLDACWNDALSMINHASVLLREGDMQPVHPKSCIFQEVREQLNVAECNSRDRRGRLLEDVTRDLTADADFLVSHCNLLSQCERAFLDKSIGNDLLSGAMSANMTIPFKP